MLAPGWWRYCCRVGRCVVTNVGPTQESDLHVSVYADGEVSQVGSRVELFEEIRRDRRSEGLSIRELAERHKVHRRAVRQADSSATSAHRSPRSAAVANRSFRLTRRRRSWWAATRPVAGSTSPPGSRWRWTPTTSSVRGARWLPTGSLTWPGTSAG